MIGGAIIVHGTKRLFALLNMIMLLTASVLPGCSLLNNSRFESPVDYLPSLEKLVVEVVHQPGAEPFAGDVMRSRRSISLWGVAEKNMEALFEGRTNTVQVDVPHSLDEMKEIPALDQDEYTLEEIADLATEYRTGLCSDSEIHLFIIFLDGLFNNDGETDDSVIGVSILGTPVIAVFKPVIQSSGFSDEGIVPKYVEQTTIIHECGHALGLVNNGVPLTSDHHDLEHGSHCTDSDCVMYWSNEGAADLWGFVTRFLLTNDSVVFCEHCLADVRNYDGG
ncbi:MAG: hypothetical protein SVY53_01595 [Chloroflexota bacterium]|nr:hypothetical protein [Chloroflexota bacterium]